MMRRVLCAFVSLAAGAQGALAQAPPERAVLEIPDSVVIQGRAQYQLQTGGNKNFTYYAKAFPVDRADTRYSFASVTTLPALSSKETFPTPVRHGAVRATQIRCVAQHYGNVLVSADRVADWRGWLFSGDGELGGGRGHTSGAGWHREAISGRVRQVVTWRSAYDAQLALESGRTGIWSALNQSHRDYLKLDAGVGLERILAGDHEVRLDVDAQQRRIGGPEASVSEQAFYSRLAWQKASGRFWVSANATADVVHTSRSVGAKGFGSLITVSGEAWTRPEENFGGALGVTIYTVDYLAGDSLRTIRPSVTAWARILNLVKFTGRLTSGVDRLGIWEAYQANPMLNVATPLRMPFRSVDIDVNAETSLEHSNVVTVGLRQLVIKDYPVWVMKDTLTVWQGQFPTEPYVRDQFALDYRYTGIENASVTAFYARYQHTWKQGSIDALGIWRVHALKEQKVPYVPDWEVHLGANIPFRQSAIFSPAVHVTGPRSYVATKTVDKLAKLGTYATVDLDASIPLRRGWLLTASLRNLLNQGYERWDGFKEPGFHLQVGVRRTW